MKSGFTTVLFKVVTDFRQFRLLEAVDYFAQDGTHYRLPVATGSDLASTPPEAWGPPLFLIPAGWYAVPGYFHDAAYRNTLQIVADDGSVSLASLTKEQSDRLLLETMEAIKPTRTLFEQAQMQAIYNGVTIGGWHAFTEDRA